MDNSSERNPVEALAEEFAARSRRGEQITIEEYADRHPDLADEIRELFPAMALLEAAGDAREDHFERRSSSVPPWTAVGNRLGDYRLERVLGRGGMGVVYEAIQQPLGRRVALKVLSQSGPLDATHAERFRREAQAAASLHHTNIVPVFDCGKEGGVQFYAMQFIQGRALDEVLLELKRMREEDAARQNLSDASEVAHSTTTVTLPGQLEARSLSGIGPEYWRSVARVGLQVADALAYAHTQGVLHRDVKPANLLLDTAGRMWVTDFGLAKASDQRKDLTRSGSVLGTLRYMAPEGLSGKGDARSDVCSLGLTLYEMVALRPAYDQSDRGELVGAIAQKAPPPLSRLRPDVPRDLEMIIHKAIERAPSLRYQTAADLHDDLRRYLANEPVRARRVSLAVRTVRWAHRNPMVAVLTGVVAVLICCGFLAAGMATLKFRGLAEDRRTAMEDAQRERVHALWRLYEARMAEATARMASGQPGQRFESLQAIHEATELASLLGYGDDERLSLRNLAIGCLSLPDLSVQQEWECLFHEDIPFDFSPRLDRYAYYEPSRRAVVIRRTHDHSEVQQVEVDAEVWPIRFSPDGEYVAFCYGDGSGRHVFVWEIDRKRFVVKDELSGQPRQAFDFSPNSERLAICHPQGGVVIYDVSSGARLRTIAAQTRAASVAYSPRGDRLAVAQPQAGVVDIYRAGAESPDRTLSFGDESGAVEAIAWSASERYVAAACGKRICVWQTEQALRPTVLAGHYGLVTRLQFHPESGLLLSSGWDNQTRVWEPAGRGLLLVADGTLCRMGATGDRVALHRGKKLALLRMAYTDMYAAVRAAQDANDRVRDAAMHPCGQLIVTCGNSGLSFYDVEGLAPLARLSTGVAYSVEFDPKGDWLYYTAAGGVFRRAIEWCESAGSVEVRVGPAQPLPLPIAGQAHHLDLDAKGTTLATDLLEGGRLVVVDLEGKRKPVVIEGDIHLMFVDLSPDGRWVVTGNYHGSRVEVYDATSGRSVFRVPEHRAAAAFSPDGERLVLTGFARLHVVDVGTWKEMELANVRDALTSEYPRFCPRTYETAVAGSRHVMLFDAITGEELATFAAARESWGAVPARFCANGALLLTRITQSSLGIWNLARLRSKLAEIGLDWSAAPLPQVPPYGEKHLQTEVVVAR